MCVSNSYHFQKFVNNTSQWVIAICTCTNVWGFKYRGVKMFLFKLVSKPLNLIKKILLHSETFCKTVSFSEGQAQNKYSDYLNLSMEVLNVH